MAKKKVSTKEIAEQFLTDEDSVDLDDLRTIEDAAAESLSEHKGHLDLDNLPDSAAQILRDAGHG